MSWKYYRNGKLVKKCDDLPETMEDAAIELQENGHDVSDCIIDDNWSPDYPPEEAEYQDTLTFKPLSDKELKAYKKMMKSIPKLKVSNDFEDKLFKRLEDKKFEEILNKVSKENKIFINKTLPTLSYLIQFKYWCSKWYWKLKTKTQIWYWKMFK